MKKIAIIIACLFVMCCCVAACSGKSSSTDTTKDPKLSLHINETGDFPEADWNDIPDAETSGTTSASDTTGSVVTSGQSPLSTAQPIIDEDEGWGNLTKLQ